MEAKFWLERWEKKEIGFHKAEVNSSLLAVSKEFHFQRGQRVFVPLCGKSVDLVWFSNQGLKVTGVEISPLACAEFFRENAISFTRRQNAHFEVYASPQVEIWCGDFFEFQDSREFDLIYDRASNIALPPLMRPRYYQHLKSLIQAQTRLCLITIEYNQQLVEGPPFSVSEEEIRKVYSEFQITKLRDIELVMDNKKFEDAKVTTREKIYCISKER